MVSPRHIKSKELATPSEIIVFVLNNVQYEFPCLVEQRYRIMNRLGSGSFGIVYECQNLQTKLKLVCKIVSHFSLICYIFRSQTKANQLSRSLQ
jgi:serine/threonine protein kinase